MDGKTKIENAATFDWLDFRVARFMAAAIALVIPALGLIWPVVNWIRGRSLTWQLVAPTEPPAVDGTAAGTVARWSGEAVVTLDHASAGTWLATLLPGLVITLATWVAVWCVWKLLRAIQSGAPFVGSSVWYVRGIAVVLLLTPALLSVAQLVSDSAVSAVAFPDTPGATLHLTGLAVMPIGLIVAAIGEAFARGERLQRDVDGLV